ncbi:MAG: hypothetical protein WAK33_25805 [Silvibacterium sp.]
MRTTLSIDDDVAELLEKEVRQSGDSFKGTVNRLLRLGLIAAHRPEKRKPFVVKPLDITFPAGLSLDKTEEILGFLEGPTHK